MDSTAARGRMSWLAVWATTPISWTTPPTWSRKPARWRRKSTPCDPRSAARSAANQENLVLTGTAAINGTGNALANRLTGNACQQRLNGGAGADTMAGGLGNDTYIVDNAADVVTEASALATEIDTVHSSVSRALGANQENLVLTGAAAINGAGNALANRITGNAAANSAQRRLRAMTSSWEAAATTFCSGLSLAPLPSARRSATPSPAAPAMTSSCWASPPRGCTTTARRHAGQQRLRAGHRLHGGRQAPAQGRGGPIPARRLAGRPACRARALPRQQRQRRAESDRRADCRDPGAECRQRADGRDCRLTVAKAKGASRRPAGCPFFCGIGSLFIPFSFPRLQQLRRARLQQERRHPLRVRLRRRQARSQARS